MAVNRYLSYWTRKVSYFVVTIVPFLFFVHLGIRELRTGDVFRRREPRKYEEPKVDQSKEEVRVAMVSSAVKVPQDNKHLVEIIREDFLVPPSKLPYSNMEFVGEEAEEKMKGQMNQAELVMKYLKGKKRGFFIEAGAWNGEYLSNSLFFEQKLNWTGLLVEANKKAFEELLSKHRKAFAINSCLSLNVFPEEVLFDGADVFGGVVGADKPPVQSDLQMERDALPANFRQKYRVQCFPLYSILLALGNPKVDYFSLDVEGSELSILKTIPWNLVDIEVLTIEVGHSDRWAIEHFMHTVGYSTYKYIGTIDIMFVKNHDHKKQQSGTENFENKKNI